MIGERLRCMRCGYEWASRKEGRPVRCPNPKCQPANWDQPVPANEGDAPKLTLGEWLDVVRKHRADIEASRGKFDSEAITGDLWRAREERAEAIWPTRDARGRRRC